MSSAQRIAVAGATGRVGHHAVDVLTEQGHQVVPISRTYGVDVITGKGLAAALAGVECVIDATTGPSPEQQPATEFFTTAARNLQEAGQQAGVQRLAVVSIVGVAKSTGGYGAAKQAHEQAMRSGPIPVRVLRATQFHEFVAQLVDWGTQGDVAYVPAMRTQLVAARTVAEVLASVATGPGPDGAEYTEVAGPREERLAEMARLLAGRRGYPAKIEEVIDESDPDQELGRSGGLLPGPGAILGGPTYAEWLESAA
jgi:uncharacterized protein YbjT (DUF2867 family)